MRVAAYCRFSSDTQREASIDDQLRACRELCVRNGWPAPEIYKDAAISGTRADRPEFTRLLRDAMANAFDTLVLWDLKRLSRGEDSPQLLARFRYWRVRVVTCDGFDSSHDGSEVRGWVEGMIGNVYLKDLARATHRGLTGRALAGSSAGGLPFGYSVTETGRRAVDPAQAEVVRLIFASFASGRTARAIAADLNAKAVPTARGGAWCMTAIYGDTKRGIGILANPIYVGRQIWNRSRWIKHPDSGRRQRVERPESEWIITERPELAIVDQALWEAAQRRIMETRAKTAEGAARGKKRGGGAQHRYLLSGLLRCEECGGPLVIVDRYRYGCATRKDRGETVCGSRLKVARARVEQAVLRTLKDELLTEEAFRLFEREARAALKDAGAELQSAQARLREAERVLENLMAALRAGIITPGTKAALTAAEADVDTAKRALQAAQDYQPEQIMPRARETWRRLVEALESGACVTEAREAVRETLGDRIVLTSEAGTLYAVVPATGEITVVAGAGFARCLTELKIPIQHQTDGKYNGD